MLVTFFRGSLARSANRSAVFSQIHSQLKPKQWMETVIRCRRNLFLDFSLEKRRKTDEEKKSPNFIQYSPKKQKNQIVTHGFVDVWRGMTVENLSERSNRSLDDVQEVMLYVKGVENIEPSARLEDPKIIREIVTKLGMKVRITAPPDKESVDEKDRDIAPRPPAPSENLKPRTPVVTVMGHVDHGKTTLLDTLRGADIAAGEAGGITQHIGAFTVTLENGEKVTFLDTPGHAAFSAMRARGANVTDIIILVVAADDGVMEQTREVIKLAQDASVPIIVAVNKIDKPEADIEKTKRELAQMGLTLEEHGGDTQMIPVSALKGTNLQLLAEAVCTQAVLMGLKAEYTGLVEGVVVESKTDIRRGKLSTIIVTRGTLRKSAYLVSGLAHAKVRGIFDHNGNPLDLAEPGTPVEILGWRELPLSGDIILEVESEKIAHSVVRWREQEARKTKAEMAIDEIRKKEEEHLIKYRAEREARRMAGRRRWRNGQRPKETMSDDGIPRVNVIIKGDVHGSVEAILDVLETYTSNDKCRLDVVHYGVGNVCEGDLDLAKTFNAIIYAFSIDVSVTIPKTVTIYECNVIYRLIDDLKERISRELPPVPVENILGEATVLQQFLITEGRKEIPVAGCRCVKGMLKKAEKFRLMRDGEIVYDGPLDSMRHLKNEVDTIKKDVECGLRFKDTKILPQSGDIIVCYTTEMKSQKCDWDPGF